MQISSLHFRNNVPCHGDIHIRFFSRSVRHKQIRMRGRSWIISAIVVVAFILLTSIFLTYAWRSDCANTAGIYVSCSR